METAIVLIALWVLAVVVTAAWARFDQWLDAHPLPVCRVLGHATTSSTGHRRCFRHGCDWRAPQAIPQRSPRLYGPYSQTRDLGLPTRSAFTKEISR